MAQGAGPGGRRVFRAPVSTGAQGRRIPRPHPEAAPCSPGQGGGHREGSGPGDLEASAALLQTRGGASESPESGLAGVVGGPRAGKGGPLPLGLQFIGLSVGRSVGRSWARGGTLRRCWARLLCCPQRASPEGCGATSGAGGSSADASPSLWPGPWGPPPNAPPREFKGQNRERIPQVLKSNTEKLCNSGFRPLSRGRSPALLRGGVGSGGRQGLAAWARGPLTASWPSRAVSELFCTGGRSAGLPYRPSRGRRRCTRPEAGRRWQA